MTRRTARYPLRRRVILIYAGIWLAALLALGINVLADTPPAHHHCTSYHTLSGEFGNGCP